MASTPIGIRALGNLVPKNMLINGAIDHWQRGTSFTNAATVYTSDRWLNSRAGTSADWTTTRSTDVPTVLQSGFQSQYSILHTVTTADASMDAADGIWGAVYKIEGSDYAALHGKQTRLSFWVKSSVVGNYGLALRNSNNDRAYVTYYTINAPNTWEEKILSIPMDTQGTWSFDNNYGVQIAWAVGLGTNFQTSTLNAWQSVANKFGPSTVAMANLVASNGNTWQIAQVMLTEGVFDTSTRIPFQRCGRTIGDELSLCQRYCYVNSAAVGGGNTTFGVGAATNTSGAFVFVKFPVTMRAVPTILIPTGVVASDFRLDGPNTRDLTSVPSLLGTSADAAYISAAVSTANLIANAGYVLIANAGNNAKLGFTAEY